MSDYREIKELIEKHDVITLYRHIRADYDAYGSQFGLKELILANYPEKQVYTIGTDDLDNPYLLEPLDNPEEDIIKQSLAIIVDTSNAARVEGEFYKLALDSIRIDHHPFVEPICNHELIDTDASSAAQLVAELAIASGWKIPVKAADYLYAGISTDTLKMTIEKVNGRLFPVVGVLADAGINFDTLNRRIYDSDVRMFNAETAARNKIVFDGNFAYLLLKAEDLKEMNLEEEEARDMVNIMQNIRGIDKYATIIEDKNGVEFNISLRSHGIVINDIAAKYGGGGHPNASGIGHLKPEFVPGVLKDMKEKQ